MLCSRCGELMAYPGSLVRPQVSLLSLLHKIHGFCLTVWKNHVAVDITEPVRMFFTLPIRFYTYLDLKLGIKKIKVAHGPVLQKQRS